MRKRLAFFFLLVLHLNNSQAQVILQNGAAQFALPLYDYSDANNRLSTSVVLNYANGNGLKVSEMATSVGTGWNLNAGGFIQRLQHGEPDDQQQTGSYTYGTPEYVNDYFPNGFLYSEYNAYDPVDDPGGVVSSSGSAQEYRQRPKYLTDREQDVFAFSFNGRQGQFVIGKTTGTWDIRTLVDSKLKIEKLSPDLTASNIRTRISGFKITDESGIQYIFKDLELSEVVKYNDKRRADNVQVPESQYQSSSCSVWPNTRIVTLSTALNQFVVDKWFLSEIINPYSNTKITFTYEDYNIDIKTDKLFQKSTASSQCSYSLTWFRSKGISKRLLQITCSPSEKVVFAYSPGFRTDLPFDKTLDKISVLYNNELRHSWDFTYGYFVKNRVEAANYTFTAAELPFARLCLQSVKRMGNDGNYQNPYNFNYYTTEVPAMFSYYHDHWGYANTTGNPEPGQHLANTLSYYNYPGSFTNIQQFRNLVPDRAKDGILKTIEYPTGGTLTYEYEQNEALDKDNNWLMTGGVRVKKTIVYDGVDNTKNQITEYSYLNTSGTSSGWLYEPLLYSENMSFDIYDCSDGYPGMIAYQTASLGFSIVRMDPIGIYNSTSALVKLLSIENVSNVTGVMYSSEPLNNDNQLPVQYARAETTQKSASDNNGKIVYTFTDRLYHPLYRATSTLPYSSVQRLAGWAYGLPRTVSVYDKTGKLVRKTEHDYNIFEGVIGLNEFASQKWVPKTRFYACENGIIYGPGGPFNGDIYSRIARDIYHPLHGKAQLTNTREYTYNDNNEEFMRNTYFEYATFNDDVKFKSTTSSKGEYILEYTYYPEDFNYGANSELDILKNRGISVPVAIYTYVAGKKVNNTDKWYLIKGAINEYGVTANGDVKLMKTHEYRNAVPVEIGQISFNPDVLVPAQYFIESKAVQYDNSGQPEKTTARSRVSTSIFDYNNSLVIAEAVNANENEIAYTSFEADGKGKWSFNGIPQTDANAITGKRSYVLTGNPLSKTISNTAQNYIVTYWSKNSLAYSITGTQAGWPQQQYTVNVNGDIWYLHKHIVTGVSSIQIAGSGVIDEVRLCPERSRMTTYTYAPLVGVTSKADANNRIVFNEYDGLGRLVLVRDQDKNIVKKLCYNYTGQTENCSPKMFQSDSLYERYLWRNNCSPQLPTAVTVSVPYGMFNSIISQGDANAKAAAYAQQVANQQGRCNPVVYARLEISESMVDEYDYGTETYKAVYVQVLLKFYSDPGCTQSYTLTSPLDFGVTSNGCIDYLNTNNCYTGTQTYHAPAGVDSYLISDLTSLYGDWNFYDENGNVTYMERWRDYYNLDPITTNCGIVGNYYTVTLPPGY